MSNPFSFDESDRDSSSSKKHYDYLTQGNGAFVTLKSPECNSIFLQGDDAAYFLEEIESLDNAWDNGNPNPDCFDSYEDYQDVIISQYF